VTPHEAVARFACAAQDVERAAVELCALLAACEAGEAPEDLGLRLRGCLDRRDVALALLRELAPEVPERERATWRSRLRESDVDAAELADRALAAARRELGATRAARARVRSLERGESESPRFVDGTA